MRTMSKEAAQAEGSDNFSLMCWPWGPSLTTPGLHLSTPGFAPTSTSCHHLTSVAATKSVFPGSAPPSEPFLNISTQSHAVLDCSLLFIMCFDSRLLTKSTPWVCLSRNHRQSRVEGWPTESLNKHMLVDLSLVKDTTIISSGAFFIGLLQGERKIPPRA